MCFTNSSAAEQLPGPAHETRRISTGSPEAMLLLVAPNRTWVPAALRTYTSTSVRVPGGPLTEKNGESHCSTMVKLVPPPSVKVWNGVLPKLWAVPPRNVALPPSRGSAAV